jgi:hypothetical protein
VRWERLFDELEGNLEHEAVLERDALVEELREGEWSQVSWTQLLRRESLVELQVRDVGPVRGTVRFANRTVIHVASQTTEHVVAVRAVAAASGEQRPGPPPLDALSGLGWGHVLRNAEVGTDLRFDLAGGHVIEGTIHVVGADFVRLTTVGGSRVVPFAAIRMMTVVA